LTIGGTSSAILNLSINGADTGYIIHDGANITFNNRTNGYVEFFANGLAQHRIAPLGVFSWYDGAGGTRMTLNSTGLGVGVVPSVGKLEVDVGAGGFGYFRSTTYSNLSITGRSGGAGAGGCQLFLTTTGSRSWFIGNRTDTAYGASNSFFIRDDTASATRLEIDSSGNVGVGVTPSAWGSNSKALQVGGGTASVSSTGAGSTASRFAHGAYFDNTNWLYQYTGVGPALYQVTGANAGSTHAWYIAPGGTAGNAITFTQAMTLDASGNLLVGTTSTAGSVSNTTKTVGGVFSSINGTTASTASGSAVTLFAAPTESSYLLSAYLFGAGSASAYHVVAIVKVNGGNVAITAISSATGISISSSGLNIQATQTSGISQAVSWNVVRLS
jgi:hypothetical protein